VLPVGDDSPCVEEILEPADVQAFLAQSVMKTLNVAVLRWLAGLRVDEVDLALQIPDKKVPARQLGPLSQRIRLRHAALRSMPLYFDFQA